MSQPRSQATLLHNTNTQGSFSHEHDVIEKEPEFSDKKDNVSCDVHPTIHTTLGV